MIPFLDSSLQKVKGIGDKYLKVLKRYRYISVYDLLIHFPEYYINTSVQDNMIEDGIEKVYNVKVNSSGLYRNYRRRLSVINISGTIGDSSVDIAIFNKPYMLDKIRASGEIKIYGKVKVKGIQNRIENPRILKTEEGIIPVYKNIGTIAGGTVKNLIENIFAHKQSDDDILPQNLVKAHGFDPFWESLENIHFPGSPEINTEKLRERFIYTEFLFFQLETAFIRERSGKINRERMYKTGDHGELLDGRINFELTHDQNKSVREIASDLTGNFTMQRLLLGDVGSGKTIISFLFLLIAVKNGYQGAFLAPTEILIGQHFQNALTFFKGINIDLLTGSTPSSERKRKIEELKEGKTSILFGTHSIINEKIVFKDLSAIVIDEQHRFGVSQRAALFYKGIKADLMVTTATPIPRTLLLSLYKDLDVSEIRSMPAGRVPVETLILKQDIREEFYSEIKKRTDEGEKAFIVLPLISRSTRFKNLRSLEGELPFFKNIFKGSGFGVISGRSDPDERKSIFNDFSEGKIKILISTTVIEVGIDIRDATIMVIEDADKYGLSQLHQLRGRVGRGDKKSFCYLFPSSRITGPGSERLKIMRETSNGFEIAEKDLGMRGGGNIAGTEQSGYLDFRISDIKEYPELYFKASRDAAELIKDISLQNIHIKKKLEQIEAGLEKISFS
ncbi:MAG: ATP-dependent DNA helicase RecG [Acidobacteriota bacterium]